MCQKLKSKWRVWGRVINSKSHVENADFQEVQQLDPFLRKVYEYWSHIQSSNATAPFGVRKFLAPMLRFADGYTVFERDTKFRSNTHVRCYLNAIA